MLKYLQLVSTLFFAGAINAQDFDWASQFSGTGYGQGLDVTTDNTGNVISIGTFQGDYDFDPGAGTADFTAISDDIYITKLDEDEMFLWAKQIGSFGSETAWGIATDNVGDIFVTGSFQGSVDFDPGPGDETITAVGAQDIFILKLSGSGDFEWVKTMGSADNESGETIEIDASNNIIVTGLINNGTVDMDPGAGVSNLTGNYDSYILKLNSSGDFVWAKLMVNATNIVYISDCKVDASGNIFTTGYFRETTNFNTSGGTDELTSFGNRDIFVCKTNSSGDLLWAKQMGGSDADAGHDIALDASGNVFIAGIFNDEADFDPGADVETLISAGGYDIFACKLDPSGDYVWANGFGGTEYDEGAGIAVSAAGLCSVVGAFHGTADFDPGAGTNNLISAGLGDGVIVQLNVDGSLNQAMQIGGTENDWVQAVTLDPTGNVLVTGWFAGSADLNPSAGTETFTSAGFNDPFVIRLKLSGVGIFDENLNEASIQLYPNPAHSNVTVESAEIIENITVYSLTGEIVLIENITDEQNIKTFSVAHLKSGVYLVQIKSDLATTSVRLIKE